ncbi:MAG: S53 family peptidase [Caulobacteraceae bacterium]
MYRHVAVALVAAGALAGAASVATAAIRVEKSGNTYHVAVCPYLVAPGFARCHAHVVTDASGRILSEAARQNTTPRGYGPTDLQSAYAVTTPGSSTVTVAIVDAFGYTNAERDLGIYRAQYGLPPCTTANGCFQKLNEKGQAGPYPADNTGWAQESALDLDMVSSMCPNCKIVLVEANSNGIHSLGTSEDTAVALGAHVVSNSYGGGEAGAQVAEKHFRHPGVAITASSGDGGYAAGPQFPATSPDVTAVGGTHLVRDGSTRGWNETVWTGAGSGCSTVFHKPTWQHDSGCSMRMEADVSADADPATGVAVYAPVNSTNSAWLVFGGTSVAAPLVGGIYGNNGGSVTFGKNPYKNTSALNDVTSGNNGSCPSAPAYFCNAEVGYDGPTGLGTPIGVTAF